MEPSAIKSKYRKKATDSFKTRLDLFLFDRILKRTLSETIYEIDFGNFRISSDLITIYTTKYHQLEYDQKIHGIEIKEIRDVMDRWKEEQMDIIKLLKNYYIENIFPRLFAKEQFTELLTDSDPKCYYCGITQDDVEILIDKQRLYKKSERGFKLEIDRKKPNEEYTPENSVLCCYWCNNAKTDEFCDEEFMEIGVAIRNVWRKRLST